MEEKRLHILAGHYGSGKTNIALNLAMALKKTHAQVTVADMDIVNPYFRTKDSEEELKACGIRLICSPYAGSNVDLPALPQELYRVTQDRTVPAVLDIGGDDRGALALGRYTPEILSENNYEMYCVINCYRPLTRGVEDTVDVMREIEAAGHIPFTALINNSNLGEETTPNDVRKSMEYADRLAERAGLPVRMTTVAHGLYAALNGEIPNLFPLTLQSKMI